MHVHTTTTHDDRATDRPGAGRIEQPDSEGSEYLPGLTGLRALAVVGVVVAATGHAWLPGGELVGIEVFLVISGYLTVTSLDVQHRRVTIADEARRLRSRLRRILPALVTLLGGVSLLVLVERPDELYLLGADIRAALLGVYNWHLIRTGASVAPAWLQHLWPLAVGVQATAVVMIGALAVRSRRARGVAALGAVALAVAASTALAVLAFGGEVGPRWLYGTDVRAGGLLLGAALALGIRPAPPGGVGGVRGRRVRAIVVLALIGLVLVMFVGSSQASWIGRGGVLVTDALALLAVAGTVRGAPLRVLDGVLAQWIGLRAYALYLWYWPVVVALGGPAAVSRPLTTAVYLLAVVLLGDLTYRFVEVPLASTWQLPGTGVAGRPAVAAGVVALACGATFAAAAMSPPPSL